MLELNLHAASLADYSHVIQKLNHQSRKVALERTVQPTPNGKPENRKQSANEQHCNRTGNRSAATHRWLAVGTTAQLFGSLCSRSSQGTWCTWCREKQTSSNTTAVTDWGEWKEKHEAIYFKMFHTIQTTDLKVQ